MKFVIAKSAGFCFGVKKAVETVENNIGKFENLYTFGEIIHNPQVVENFKRQNVFPIDSVDSVNNGAVIIRSHGAPQSEIDKFLQKNIKIIDATCPFVKRIQKIVQNALQKSHFIVIIGEESHPEVIGINGHCDNSGYIVNSVEEVKALPDTEKVITVVAQTTTRKELFNSIVDAIKSRYSNETEVFDTICDATIDRQTEAMKIAGQVDVMIVIGGRQSSNTAKLYKICKEKCSRTYGLENSCEVSTVKIYKNDVIGVTAGASTPDWLIKEVVDTMSENTTENMSFEEALNESFANKIRQGQVITGKVIYVKDDEVSVDIGYKADGIITKEELSASGDEDPKALFNEGDDIEVEVVKVNDGNGNVILSRKKVVARLAADEKLATISNGEIFEVQVGEAVKGGLIADYCGIRVFIPRSQIRANGFAKDVDKYVGQTLRVRAIDIDAKHRKVVATHGAILQEERDAAIEAAWAKLEVGATVKGIVRRLTDFGAFVDLGGVDGLVHIGDIAWYHINKPGDVLKVNDEIDVKVLALDKENNRISLGYKQLFPQPWETAEEKYAVDTVVKGTVARITAFGAFVALEPGIDGLVHISQLSNKFISKVDEAVKVGDEIEALVLDVNAADKKISLSIKALIPEEELAEALDEEAAEEVTEEVNE